jgi:hypothetical protein
MPCFSMYYNLGVSIVSLWLLYDLADGCASTDEDFSERSAVNVVTEL